MEELKDEAHPRAPEKVLLAPVQTADLRTIQYYGARGGFFQAAKQVEQRRFAAAAWATEGNELTSMQLEAANAQLRQQHIQTVEDILHSAMTSARGTLAEARRAIEDLRIISSREDFIEAVDEEIRRFTSATGITCKAELQALNQVPAILYEHAFLAVREGLNNIARHAQAHAATVRIVPEGEVDTPVIEVQDDGIGFEPESAGKQPGHYGLIGLRERARLAIGNPAAINQKLLLGGRNPYRSGMPWRSTSACLATRFKSEAWLPVSQRLASHRWLPSY